MPQNSSLNTSYVRIVLLVFVPAVIFISGYIFVQEFFKIRKIEVVDKNPKIKSQLKSVSNLSDYNLLLTSDSDLVDFIKKSNPTIEEVIVKKEYPDKIVITTSLYKTFAQIKGDRGYLVVSANGTVLATSKDLNQSLPLVTYYQLLNMSIYEVGSKLNFEDIKSSLTFLKSSLDLGMKTTKIEISGYHMIALYAQNEKIIFSQEKDIGTQKYQFETIVKDLRAQGMDFVSLDVRFDKPVIVFK